jgi:toxin ParE1/3/4
MGFKIVRSAGVDTDLDLINDHLFESYIDFGDTVLEAAGRAAARVRSIESDMEALARSPHQGTLSPEIAHGLRHVTKNKAILYFEIDDVRQIVLILAVFFSGQNHERRIVERLGRT